MGLLEDAIREHLELKRLRGADPAEVAREQHEALPPSDTEAPAGQADGHVGENGAEATGDAPAREVPAGGEAAEGPDVPQGSDLGSLGEETAELDMQTVLGQHGGATSADDGTAAAAGEESLEWEIPASPPRRAGGGDPADGDREPVPEMTEQHGSEEPEQGAPGADGDAPRQGRLSR
jgi:hypothetical protein